MGRGPLIDPICQACCVRYDSNCTNKKLFCADPSILTLCVRVDSSRCMQINLGRHRGRPTHRMIRHVTH